MLNRRRLAQGLTVLTLLSTAALAAPLCAGAAGSSPTATSVITSTKAAMKAAKSVHVKVTSTVDKEKSSVVADIGASAGRETYVEGKATFTIAVNSKYAYLSGSKTGLIDLMGLTAAEQKQVGSDWIAIKKGTSEYTEFDENLTTGSFSDFLPAPKGTTLLAKRASGSNGYQLSWTTKATSSAPKSSSLLTISSGAKSLPIKEVVTSSDGTSTTTFSKWGESVTVSAPSPTIAFSTVFK